MTQAGRKIYDTSGFWKVSPSNLYKEGNVHSFDDDLIEVGDVNVRLTQIN